MRHLWILCAIVAFVTNPVRAAGTEWEPAPGARIVWLLQHPLHDVTAVAEDIRLLRPLRFDPVHLPDSLTDVAELPVQVPWSAFDSGNRNRDANMLLAVKAEAFPLATFVLERISSVTAVAPSVWQGTLDGRLYLAGQKQSVTATARLDLRLPQAPRVRAGLAVDMRDFGIKPPRLLMFTADPVVRVEVDLPLRPARRTTDRP